MGEDDSNTDDGDASYERDLYQVTLMVNPGKRLGPISGCELEWQHQRYYFTSEQAYFLDPTHVGRLDRVWAYEAKLETRPIWGPATLEAGYRYTKRRSSSASSLIEGADSIEEDKNYQNNRTWLGMSYPF